MVYLLSLAYHARLPGVVASSLSLTAPALFSGHSPQGEILAKNGMHPTHAYPNLVYKFFIILSSLEHTRLSVALRHAAFIGEYFFNKPCVHLK